MLGAVWNPCAPPPQPPRAPPPRAQKDWWGRAESRDLHGVGPAVPSYPLQHIPQLALNRDFDRLPTFPRGFTKQGKEVTTNLHGP